MKVEDLDVRATGTTRIEPGSSKLIHALRNLGYTFEQAVSDLIDNSISAEATRIILRFVTSEGKLHSFIIADNGHGMSASKLDEAMRFGSADDYNDQSLGKYGLGLKLASLSHATAIDVLTRQKSKVAARRWTVAGLSKNWQCEVLDEADALRVMERQVPTFSSGTLVVWHQIDRLNLGKQGVRKGLEQLHDRLHMHVGLYFHRFLETKGVRISTEIVDLDVKDAIASDEITPINPFAYPATGHSEYPRNFDVDIADCGTLQMRACIWPANAKGVEYKLGGKAAQRQGFYFYRKDRLIQAGGWNGVVEHEAEPHTSLARIAVDLPAKLDGHFGLSVQKSKVVTPPAFVPGVTNSRDAIGELWLAKYRKAANQAYRHDDRIVDSYPMLPSEGLPRDLIDLVRDQLADGRQRKIRNVRFKWSKLASPDFFEIDKDDLVIRLNSNYRSAVLAGNRGTPSDAPLLKVLLFFVLQDDLDRDRMTSARKQRLEAINRILSEAIKFEDRS